MTDALEDIRADRKSLTEKENATEVGIVVEKTDKSLIHHTCPRSVNVIEQKEIITGTNRYRVLNSPYPCGMTVERKKRNEFKLGQGHKNFFGRHVIDCNLEKL